VFVADPLLGEYIMSSNRLDEQDLLETMFAPGEDDENDPSAMSLVDHL